MSFKSKLTLATILVASSFVAQAAVAQDYFMRERIVSLKQAAQPEAPPPETLTYHWAAAYTIPQTLKGSSTSFSATPTNTCTASNNKIVNDSFCAGQPKKTAKTFSYSFDATSDEQWVDMLKSAGSYGQTEVGFNGNIQSTFLMAQQRAIQFCKSSAPAQAAYRDSFGCTIDGAKHNASTNHTSYVIKITVRNSTSTAKPTLPSGYVWTDIAKGVWYNRINIIKTNGETFTNCGGENVCQ